jgi:thiol:disulfide interchange protein DsbC
MRKSLNALRRGGAALACAAVFLVHPRNAHSAEPAKADPLAGLKKTVESAFPGSHVLDAQPSAIPGVYELFLGDQIVYADGSGEHLLVGPMIETRTHANLTEARMNERGRIDFKSLPLNQAIKVVKGNGSRTFAVFSDPDCPYCQALEKSLVSVNDVTMYVFLFPIDALHPQASVKAKSIWCAKDRAAAWEQWMQEKRVPVAATCGSDPVADLQHLGDKLHINSTPTIFFADGRRVSGAVPAKDIEQHLVAAK